MSSNVEKVILAYDRKDENTYFLVKNEKTEITQLKWVKESEIPNKIVIEKFKGSMLKMVKLTPEQKEDCENGEIPTLTLGLHEIRKRVVFKNSTQEWFECVWDFYGLITNEPKEFLEETYMTMLTSFLSSEKGKENHKRKRVEKPESKEGEPVQKKRKINEEEEEEDDDEIPKSNLTGLLLRKYEIKKSMYYISKFENGKQRGNSEWVNFEKFQDTMTDMFTTKSQKKKLGLLKKKK